MNDGTWSEALAEIVASVVAAFVRFWKNDVVQVGLTVAFFFALAIPLLLVLLLLWYLDSTGWRPEGGFYKIGLIFESPVEHAGATFACTWMYVQALSAGFEGGARSKLANPRAAKPSSMPRSPPSLPTRRL
jgi:ABC-type dipeptide/oligopeptide/nickel transport system permease component